jgi:hypothetical protein
MKAYSNHIDNLKGPKLTVSNSNDQSGSNKQNKIGGSRQNENEQINIYSDDGDILLIDE